MAPMPARTPASSAYVVGVTVLWGVAMPAVLITDAGGAVLPWRDPIQVAAAALLVVAGAGLVDRGARTLVAAGIGLLGVGPGSRLVRTGLYGRIRNPIDLGTVLIALATWVGLAIELMWVIPVGAIVYFVAGVGPYEDRRLLETFDDEFRDYRAAVSKWLPKRRPRSDA